MKKIKKELTNKEAAKIFIKCLDEMYRKSTPSITWEEIVKKYSNTTKPFFMKHSLSEQDYNRIRDKYSKKLTAYQKRQLDWCLLGYSPTISS